MSTFTITAQPDDKLHLREVWAEGESESSEVSLCRTGSLLLLSVTRGGKTVTEQIPVKGLIAAWLDEVEFELDKELPREIIRIPASQLRKGDQISNSAGKFTVRDVQAEEGGEVSIDYRDGKVEVYPGHGEITVERVIRHG